MPPPPDVVDGSGFCLFFACPWVCYNFPEPEAANEEKYKVELIVWDNSGEKSVPDAVFITIGSSGNPTDNDIYVWGIYESIHFAGSKANVKFTVTIRQDSNANSQPEYVDATKSYIKVTMTLNKDNSIDPDGIFDGADPHFAASTFTGITDSNGIVTFSAKGLREGDYQAMVTELIDPNGEYEWNNELDAGNLRNVTIW